MRRQRQRSHAQPNVTTTFPMRQLAEKYGETLTVHQALGPFGKVNTPPLPMPSIHPIPVSVPPTPSLHRRCGGGDRPLVGALRRSLLLLSLPSPPPLIGAFPFHSQAVTRLTIYIYIGVVNSVSHDSPHMKSSLDHDSGEKNRGCQSYF